MLATGTASGKSLVYQIAAAESALVTPKATALFLFPTKALARDQLRAIRAFKLPQVRAAVYDGDTPQAERPLIRRNANLVLTNPDMLHLALLADHARWADFMLRLAVVVVDEAHVLRGVFGSHVAMVLRRLRRLIALHGGDPRWCLSSATIGNPGELAERLTGLDIEVIEADAAPRGRKLFAMWNPPIVDDETGARRSALAEAATVMTTASRRRRAHDRVHAVASRGRAARGVHTARGLGRPVHATGSAPTERATWPRTDARSSRSSPTATSSRLPPRTRSSSGSTSARSTRRC